MKNKLLWLISFIPLFVTLVVLRFMPASVPAHYNLKGQVDRWGSKYENLIFPIFIILFALFWIGLISYYNKKAKTSNNDKEVQEALSNVKALKVVSIVMAIFFGCDHCFILYNSYKVAMTNATSFVLDINTTMTILTGIMLIILGNYLPKTKRNAAIGVRTTWSMKDDEAWARSNRLGGIVLVITGIILIIVALLTSGIVAIVFMIIALILDGILCCVISYKVSKI